MTTAGTAAAALLGAAVAAGVLTAPAHAVSGDGSSAGSYAFAARLAIGADDTARACTGSLVAPQWILTAASCFAADPETAAAAAGRPALKTVATVSGKTGEVVELVPRAGRDIVLARLAKPLTGITPVPLSATAATAGEQLKAAGYGRTKTDWVPGSLRTAAFTVGTAGSDDIAVTGVNAALCKGDTGGPLLREAGGQVSLVGVSSRSWQGGCFNEKETRTGAVASRADDLAAWVTTTVNAARITDFNGDGVPDTAVGDPAAAVGGLTSAGLVRVVYGGGKGTAEITQNSPGVGGSAEASDWYGESLAVVDHNLDGYSDLVVGAPAEDIGDQADSGFVQIVYGAAAGLTKGQTATTLEQGKGAGAILAGAPEAGDRMGHSLTAGVTTGGEPYLLIGVPGEDLDGVVDAGNAYYLRGTTNTSINQGKDGVPGVLENGDRFGTSLAGSPEHLAVGAPAEDIGDQADSGSVQVLKHGLTGGFPTPVVDVDQDDSAVTVTGSPEAGDQFGASLSLTSYRTTASDSATATDSILAVGSPGEALGTVKEAGRVVTLRITAAGKASQLGDISQDPADVVGAPEEADHFGRQVSVASTVPGAVATAQNMRLAVGVPDEDIGTASNAGSITAFSLLGNPGDSDVAVEPGMVGLPGASGANQRLGTSVFATAAHLYVGMPYGPAPYGAVHTVPWANIVSAASEPVTTYQPGQGGLPAAGTQFGSVVR
ncbi:trypsin-like serine protease [Streptomyces beigongshangae]|uniref:trypsin-like serine protease n=1 Tax=Streptomyces beigongshangae TaxID=2841597 RepID=UPI0027E08105|nr:trypsin-like serine protease [Streptomyces sp. REN17]